MSSSTASRTTSREKQLRQEGVMHQAIFNKAVVNCDVEAFRKAIAAMDKIHSPDPWHCVVTSGVLPCNAMNSLAETLPFASSPGRVLRATEMIQILLDRGVEVDTPETYGFRTPLMSAIRSGTTDMMKFLISRGASPSSSIRRVGEVEGENSLDKWLPMRYLFNENTEFARKDDVAGKLKILLSAGASIEEASQKAGHPMMKIAVESGRWNAVLPLLEAGVDPNESINGSVSAIMLAKQIEPEIHANMCAWMSAKQAVKAIDDVLSIAEKGVSP